MKYKIDGDRLFIEYDDSTSMQFDLDKLEEKINNLPVDYMSSQERIDLISDLKDSGIL